MEDDHAHDHIHVDVDTDEDHDDETTHMLQAQAQSQSQSQAWAGSLADGGKISASFMESDEAMARREFAQINGLSEDAVEDYLRLRRDENVQVLQNVRADLDEARAQSPLVLCIYLIFVVAELVGTAVVTVISWNQPCDKPLRWFILLFTSRLIIHMPLISWRYRLLRQGVAPEDMVNLRRVAGLVEFLALGLFILGQVWLFSSETCSATAPALYTYALIVVIVIYASIALPIALLLALCLCLPCVIFVLRLVSDPQQGRGASEDVLDNLERRTYDKDTDHIAADPSLAEMCAICRADFAFGDTLIKLPCTHEYHSDCILPWLRVSKTCPICRHDITQPHV